MWEQVFFENLTSESFFLFWWMFQISNPRIHHLCSYSPLLIYLMNFWATSFTPTCHVSWCITCFSLSVSCLLSLRRIYGLKFFFLERHIFFRDILLDVCHVYLLSVCYCHWQLFSWWSEDKRLPFPGSIYITVKPIPLAQSLVKVKPSLRSLLPFQEESGGASLVQLLAHNQVNQTSDSLTTDNSINNSREYYQTVMTNGTLNVRIRRKRKKTLSVNTGNNESATTTRRKESASLETGNAKKHSSRDRTMSVGGQRTMEQDDEYDLGSQEEYEEEEGLTQLSEKNRGLQNEGVHISSSGLVLDSTNCSLWPQPQTTCKIPKFPWKDFSAGQYILSLTWLHFLLIFLPELNSISFLAVRQTSLFLFLTAN